MQFVVLPMIAPVRILHLDDNPLDAQLVAATLEIEREKLSTQVEYVQSKEEYLLALKRKDFDLILSDYRMPGYDGDQALEAARKVCPEIPFIMVTGELGEELVIETLKRGATDYVLKDRIFRLIPAIERALAEADNNRKRREAEERLRESEERYRQVVSNIHDALIIDDIEGRVIFANDKFLDLFGFKGDDLGKATLEDYIAPEHRKELRERHNRRMRGEEVPTQYEYRGLRSDGTTLWLEVTVVPLFDNGVPVGTQSTIRDITKRHEAEAARDRLMQEMEETEQALRESEERYRAALATHNFMLAQTDMEARYTWVHDPLLGFDVSVILGKRDTQLNNSPQARQLEEIKHRVLATGESFRGELEVLRSDGIHSYEMTIEPRRDGTGAIVGLTSAGIDVTERKQAEQSLRESRETLALAVKATHLGLFDYYPRSGIMLWNDLAKEHSGLPPDAHVDFSTFLQAIHPEDRQRVRAAVEGALKRENGGAYYAEYRTIGIQDKKERYIVARGRAYFDESGNAVRLIGARSDVTAQKRAEEALRAHEATLEAFFDASPAILNILDEELCFVQTDRLTPAYFGLDRQRLIGKSLKDLLPGFANKFLAPIVQRVIRSGKPELNVEVPGPVPGERGKRGFWQTAYFPVPLPNGRSGLGVMGIDITALKAAQREIQRLQEQYRLLVEQQTDLVAKAASNGKVLYVNGICLGLLGRTESEMASRDFRSDIYPDDFEGVANGWKKTFEAPDYRSAFEARMMTVQGWRWLSWRNRAILDEKGHPSEVILVGRDITERKEAEDEVRRNEARFRSLISSSKESVALVDEQGIILAVSESAAELLGCPAAELIRQDVHSFVQGSQVEAIVKSLSRLTTRPETPQYLVLRLQTNRNPKLWVEVEATALLAGTKIHAYFFRLRPVHLGRD